MAALQCEICGGKLMAKAGGIFECDSCGMQYDKTRIQEMVQEIKGTVKVEGTVEVQGTVKVDGPIKVEGSVTKETLMKRGRMALEERNKGEAFKAFKQVTELAPEDAEANLGCAIALSGWFDREKLGEFYINCATNGNADANTKMYMMRARRFATGELKQWFDELDIVVDRWNRETAAKKAANRAIEEANRAKVERLAAVRSRIAPAQGLLNTNRSNYTTSRKTDGTWLCTDRKLGAKLHKDVIVAQANGDLLFKADGTFQLAHEPGLNAKEIDTWRDIKTAAAAGSRVLGLRKDGTVVMADFANQGKPEAGVKNWNDVCQIATGAQYSVGLTRAGKVCFTGQINFDLRSWADIVAVDTSVGYEDPQSPPKNILKAQFQYRIAGLRSDGTVLIASNSNNVLAANSHNAYGAQAEIEAWTDIVAISCGSSHMVGLKADGTVVAAGYQADGRCDVGGWTDIVAVSAGAAHTVGLKADGTLVAVGQNNGGQCNVSGWKLFNIIDTLEEELASGAAPTAPAAPPADSAALNQEKTALQNELSNLKGFFSGKRRKEIEARLAEIDAELTKL